VRIPPKVRFFQPQGSVALVAAPCLDAALRMQLRFDPIVASDATLLGKFLSTSDWPFHVEQSVSEDWVRGRVESGHFFGSDSRSFWIREGTGPDEPLGFARVFDLQDLTPLIDLRLASAARGRGVGTLALRGLTTWVFSEYPEAGRLGGYTRHDNVAMRRVFEKCGFLQEAQHRRAWRVAGAAPVDAVGYAILRDEAEGL
jgi:RimJ/RimL family protein N-acetyltransferase